MSGRGGKAGRDRLTAHRELRRGVERHVGIELERPALRLGVKKVVADGDRFSRRDAVVFDHLAVDAKTYAGFATAHLEVDVGRLAVDSTIEDRQEQPRHVRFRAVVLDQHVVADLVLVEPSQSRPHHLGHGGAHLEGDSLQAHQRPGGFHLGSVGIGSNDGAVLHDAELSVRTVPQPGLQGHGWLLGYQVLPH